MTTITLRFANPLISGSEYLSPLTCVGAVWDGRLMPLRDPVTMHTGPGGLYVGERLAFTPFGLDWRFAFMPDGDVPLPETVDLTGSTYVREQEAQS